MSRIMYYDLETTGVDYKVSSVRQISGFLEIDGKVTDEFNFMVKPIVKNIPGFEHNVWVGEEISINEKSVVGFLAFVMMTGFAIADIVTGSLGKDLVINEFIFNAFLWLVLGSFGIGSIDKWINKGKPDVTEE